MIKQLLCNWIIVSGIVSTDVCAPLDDVGGKRYVLQEHVDAIRLWSGFFCVAISVFKQLKLKILYW